MTKALRRNIIKRIHVNQHIIKQNNKNTDQKAPPLSIKTSNENITANTIEIDGPCTVKYSPDKPLSCGARVWIETKSKIKIKG